MTFINKCVNGEASIEDVDDYVDKWHDGDSDKKLHDYLGMTWFEYSMWVTKPSMLGDIVDCRKTGKEFKLPNF